MTYKKNSAKGAQPAKIPPYTSSYKHPNSKAATTGSKVGNKSMAPRGRRSGAWDKNPHPDCKKRGGSY